MKKILFATGLGLGLISFVMAGASGNHATAPHSQLVYDTVPKDTTAPAPKPDSISINSLQP